MSLLPDFSQATLLVIDLQERLVPAMAGEDALIKHAGNLIRAAHAFGATIYASEQYPRGLGHTVPPILEALGGTKPVEKVEFSLLQAPTFEGNLQHDVIVCGVEAHVCVLQTVQDLIERGHQVWVPFDAVASRNVENRDNALALMREGGAKVVNVESLIFNALKSARHDEFKAFSKLVR